MLPSSGEKIAMGKRAVQREATSESEEEVRAFCGLVSIARVSDAAWHGGRVCRTSSTLHTLSTRIAVERMDILQSHMGFRCAQHT